MGALSRITRGMIQKLGDIISPVYNITRVYYPLRININNRKPKITIRPIKKSIYIKIKCIEK